MLCKSAAFCVKVKVFFSIEGVNFSSLRFALSCYENSEYSDSTKFVWYTNIMAELLMEFSIYYVKIFVVYLL